MPIHGRIRRETSCLLWTIAHNARASEEKVPWDHRQNARVWASEPHRLADYNRVDLDLTHELFMRVLRGEPLFLGDTTVVLPAP